MGEYFLSYILCQDPNCFHLYPETKTFTVFKIRLEGKFKLGDFSKKSKKTHSIFPLFTLRPFSQFNRTGKTVFSLAIFPTLLDHKYCALFPSVRKRCLWDSRKEPDLSWLDQSWENGERATVCSQGPSTELVHQGPSKKQKAYLDVILDHAFISLPVSVIYSSSYIHLIGQLAGLPKARLGWEAEPLFSIRLHCNTVVSGFLKNEHRSFEALEVLQHHFFHFLLVKTTCKAGFVGKGN